MEIGPKCCQRKLHDKLLEIPGQSDWQPDKPFTGGIWMANLPFIVTTDWPSPLPKSSTLIKEKLIKVSSIIFQL